MYQLSLAWENSRHYATQPLVFLQTDVWETSLEIHCCWRVTTQIWVVTPSGWSKFLSNQTHYQDLGSIAWAAMNFYTRFLDRVTSAFFSGLSDKGDKRVVLITYPTKRRYSVCSIFDEVRSVYYGMEHCISCLIRGLFKSDLGVAIAAFQLMSRRPLFVDKNFLPWKLNAFFKQILRKMVLFCQPTWPHSHAVVNQEWREFYQYISLEDGWFLLLQWFYLTRETDTKINAK